MQNANVNKINEILYKYKNIITQYKIINNVYIQQKGRMLQAAYGQLSYEKKLIPRVLAV